MKYENLKQELLDKILVLSETAWDNTIDGPQIKSWLDNFNTEKEKIHALYLLSQFMYFGSRSVRILLISLYRDLYKYRMIEKIRKSRNDSTDTALINYIFNNELSKTRFLGIGNPSESGPHLLYYFRQENRLPKNLFINTHELFKRDRKGQLLSLKFLDVNNYVFLDDFCGSGSQAIYYSREIVKYLKILNKNVQVNYLILVSTKKGKEEIRKHTKFDFVDSVFEIDDTFKCFYKKSRYFRNSPSNINREFSKKMCEKYGKQLMYTILKREGVDQKILNQESKANSLGFNNSQLLIGFHHNTPDNTLPIIWYDEKYFPWIPIFKRYNKIYNL